MSQTYHTKRARFFMLHPATNAGKVDRLEALHHEYIAYVRICVGHMLDNRRLSLARSEKQAFFPKATKLSSQIEKNARDHAIELVSTWARGAYARRLGRVISKARKAGQITESQAKSLYTIGKYPFRGDEPKGSITQEDIDLYWKLIEEHGGRKPEVRDNLPMRLSEMTARLENPKPGGAVQADYWLRVSSLESRKSIWLPLTGNPYIKQADEVSRGIVARKTKKGRWRFEAVEKREWARPEAKEEAPRIGVDVGLKVLAATSDGDLYGREFKPRFDKTYKKVLDLRANRQRQGFNENSSRLDRLESRMSGLIKTETGRTANRLVSKHPDAVFVIEDLALSGCRAQKRFAYRALQRALEMKAPMDVVNPAYTSQECPSCGYLSRSNRSGIQFKCRSCGRQAHADWVGASGVLRRSGDKDIGCGDHPSSVKATLQRRFLLRRTSRARSLGSSVPSAPSPLGRRLTTRGSPLGDTGTASNSMPASFSRF